MPLEWSTLWYRIKLLLRIWYHEHVTHPIRVRRRALNIKRIAMVRARHAHRPTFISDREMHEKLQSIHRQYNAMPTGLIDTSFGKALAPDLPVGRPTFNEQREGARAEAIVRQVIDEYTDEHGQPPVVVTLGGKRYAEFKRHVQWMALRDRYLAPNVQAGRMGISYFGVRVVPSGDTPYGIIAVTGKDGMHRDLSASEVLVRVLASKAKAKALP